MPLGDFDEEVFESTPAWRKLQQNRPATAPLNGGDQTTPTLLERDEKKPLSPTRSSPNVHDNSPQSLNKYSSPCDTDNDSQAIITSITATESVESTEPREREVLERSISCRSIPHIPIPYETFRAHRYHNGLVALIECSKSPTIRMAVLMLSYRETHDVSFFHTYGETGLTYRRDLDGHVGIDFIGHGLRYNDSPLRTEKRSPHASLKMTVINNDYAFSTNTYCRFGETVVVDDDTKIYGVMGYISGEDMDRLLLLRRDYQNRASSMTKLRILVPTLGTSPSGTSLPPTMYNTLTDPDNAQSVGPELIIKEISWKVGLKAAKEHHDLFYAGHPIYTPWSLCTKSLLVGRQAAIEHARRLASPDESDEGERSASPVSVKSSHSST
ncbi:hypothetical protein M8818_007271 [Zalaria obscura]|uniref:Uncharacterized protein n=1 Tax=Zalaria obscura TaxID=2024903 RepID=A0ACC3S4F9_9PEZI